MNAVAIQQMADRVAQLLEERLALRGRGLAVKLGKGGRLLPHRVRKAAESLAKAAEQASNPKLLGQIDMSQVAESYDTCLRHLMAVAPASRRRDMLAGLAAFVRHGVLILVIAIIAVLLWRGLP